MGQTLELFGKGIEFTQSHLQEASLILMTLVTQAL